MTSKESPPLTVDEIVSRAVDAGWSPESVAREAIRLARQSWEPDQDHARSKLIIPMPRAEKAALVRAADGEKLVAWARQKLAAIAREAEQRREGEER